MAFRRAAGWGSLRNDVWLPRDVRGELATITAGVGGGGVPTIFGTPTVGQTLTASGGTSYQWIRGTYDIPGATGSTYVLTELDSYMRVRVRDVPTGGLSAQTSLVAEAATTWEIFDPYTSLANRTISNGGAMVGTLSTSPLSNGGGPVGGAISYDLNGVSNAPEPLFRHGSFTITTPIEDSDIFVTAYDQGTGALNTGSGGGRVSVLGSFVYTPPTDASPSAATPITNAASAAGGLRFGAQSAFLMRQGGFGGTRWSQATFPSTITLQHTPAGLAYNGDGPLKIGPILKVKRAQKSMMCFTLDDANSAQYTSLFPLLQARGMVATSYLPEAGLDGSGKFTTAQALEMKAAGWAFCQDSAPNDEPLTIFGSTAAAIANLDSHGAAIIATGLADANDVKHLCYSYGASAYPSTHRTMTCTANGTTTLTAASNLYSAFIGAGMVIKGTGLATPPTVLSFNSELSIVVSEAIPTGTYGLTFCAVVERLNVTCNGTTTITPVNTTGLVVGMEMQGRDVTPGTLITAINVEGASGTITVSNAVPATCAQATFWLPDAPWIPGRWTTDAVAAGYLSGAGIGGGGGIFTGFGLTPQQAIRTERLNIETGGVAAIIANTQALIYNRMDMIGQHHWTNAGAADPATLAEWVQYLDFLAARRDAGDLDIVTVPQWYARASARSFL